MKIFISYAREDQETAKELALDLKEFGLEPWLDIEQLVPGQQWKNVVRQQIKNSTYFLALLSSNSLSKKGFVQKELKIALDLFDEFPQLESYVIPVRLEDCEPIDHKLQELHWVDLFPLYHEGLKKLLYALKFNLDTHEQLKLENDILKEKLSKANDENNELKKKIQGNDLQHAKTDNFLAVSDKISGAQAFYQILSKKENLSKAKIVRLCGWSLVTVISQNRHKLRELVEHGCELRILLIAPDSTSIKALDKIVTGTDALTRKSRNWPEIIPKDITKKHVLEIIELLDSNNITNNNNASVRFCDFQFPYGILMIEYENGTGWLSTQIYCLHPDIRSDKRLSFIIDNSESEVWKIIKQQFDTAWEDPYLSIPIKKCKT